MASIWSAVEDITTGAKQHMPHDSGLGMQDDLVKALQEEVRSLAERVTADSQRFADYENEIRVLQATLRQEKRKNTAVNINTQVNTAQPIAAPPISRFGSFIGTRKPVPATPLSPDREKELEGALERERSQRLAAERKVTEVTSEIEELSSTLFQQANDMVSVERKENAALKERIRLLEEREGKFTRRLEALEQRDAERKRRMDKIENAIKRIDRAKTLLLPR